MAELWLRLWTETPNDPKFRSVAKRSGQPLTTVIAVWMHMLCSAKKAANQGTLDGWVDEDIAAALDIETDQVAAIRTAMQGKTLDGEQLTGWSRRQPDREDAGSRDRVAEHRAKKRASHTSDGDNVTQCNADVTQCNARNNDVTQCNAPETETETDTDTEIEKEIDKEKKQGKKKRFAQDVLLLEEEFRKLVDGYGEESAREMIEILDNYKGSSGKKYKSDYKAILSWVVEKWAKEKNDGRIRIRDSTRSDPGGDTDIADKIPSGFWA